MQPADDIDSGPGLGDPRNSTPTVPHLNGHRDSNGIRASSGLTGNGLGSAYRQSGVQSEAPREKGDWDDLFFQSTKQQLRKEPLPPAATKATVARARVAHRRAVSSPHV